MNAPQASSDDSFWGWLLAGAAVLGVGAAAVYALKPSNLAKIDERFAGPLIDPRSALFPKARINALGRARCELSGEWWINDYGSVEFADGDIGDKNHEAIVLEGLVHDVLDHVGARVSDEVGGELIPQYVDEIAEALEVEPDEVDWPLIASAVEDLWPDAEKREAALAVLKGRDDARVYGMQFQGWKRLKETAVETWTLTAGDLSAIARGIGEAANEGDLDGCVFDVEVRSTGKFYMGVPWAVIERGQPAALRDFEFKGW